MILVQITMGNQKQSTSQDLTNEFWVTNISKKNVCLSDLALTIPSRQSYDLLSKGFSYTKEQLEESAINGSLWHKRHLIKMGVTHSEKIQTKKYELSTQPIQVRKRSAVVLEEPKYNDWFYTDDEFADEMSEED